MGKKSKAAGKPSETASKAAKSARNNAKRAHESESEDTSDVENLVDELDGEFDEVAQLLGENVEDPEKKQTEKQRRKEESRLAQQQQQDDAIKPTRAEVAADEGDSDNYSFDEAGFSQPTLQAIHDMGFSKMTKVQAKTIPPLLA
ncbi:hypothetical protein OXX79_005248, partial [Metschnikowia pulcherrima]